VETIIVFLFLQLFKIILDYSNGHRKRNFLKKELNSISLNVEKKYGHGKSVRD
jgi:hypothetical protein